MELDEIDVTEEEHLRLVNAIAQLDQTQYIKKPTRNEATNLTSEFNLSKSNKLDINNVVKVLENTAQHVDLSKNLKKTQNVSNVLVKPLEKPQAERIKRSTGFDEAKKKLGRWDAVVARTRTVDHVTFPLKPAKNKLQPTKVFLSKLKLKSPLEQELDEVDPPPQEESDEEEEYPMTYEEMLERRKEMAKLRAQQSFKAAKAKRQSKIKSKKYHRILKKERLKKQLKEFEELQQTDPEEALRKLEELEKARAEERHTLRHKNTGKWAKSKLIRAKYDKETRQQLAEQLAVSRGLTVKTQTIASSDDELENNEDIPDMTLSQDPNNPWMLKNGNKSNVDDEFDFGYKKYVNEKNTLKGDSSSDSEAEGNAVDISMLSELKKTLTSIKPNIKADSDTGEEYDDVQIDTDIEPKGNTVIKVKKLVSTDKIKFKKAKRKTKLTATSDWEVESMDDVSTQETLPRIDIEEVLNSLETSIEDKIQEKLTALRAEVEQEEETARKEFKKQKKLKAQKNEDMLSKLEFKKQNVRPIIDEALEENTSQNPKTESNQFDTNKILSNPATAGTDTNNIDPSRFIQAKPKYLSSALSFENADLDTLDDEEQVVPKVNIEDVFEEDDVVASFRKEKEDEINNDKPKDIDLSLPGWGSWGGKGIKAPKRKRNRFIMKAPPKMPRRDDNKGDIIIKEFKDPKLAAHKVTELPFPFTGLKDFEASIRAPLGNTFITETAHKKVIKPSVFTKAGTIIEPMDEEELLVPKNQNYKNKNVLKLLGKK